MLQVARNVRESRAEDECMHAMTVVGDRMQKMQQHSRVAVHRARYVAQHDERRRSLTPGAISKRGDGAGSAHHAAHRRAEVDGVTARRGARAADRDFR